MQVNQLQFMEESTPGLNNDLGVKITLAENSAKNKKEERGNLAEEISQ